MLSAVRTPAGKRLPQRPELAGTSDLGGCFLCATAVNWLSPLCYDFLADCDLRVTFYSKLRSNLTSDTGGPRIRSLPSLCHSSPAHLPAISPFRFHSYRQSAPFGQPSFRHGTLGCRSYNATESEG